MKNNLGDKVVSDIKKDFVAMGAHRVHGWYAWAIVGIVVGMAWGIVYVSSWSNQEVTFDASKAAMDRFSSRLGQEMPQYIDQRVSNIEITPLGQKIERARAEGELNDVIVEGGKFTRTNEGDDLINFNSRDVYAINDPIGMQQLYTKLKQLMSGDGPFRVTLSAHESYFLNGLSSKNIPLGFNTVQVSDIAGDATTGTTTEAKMCECSADVTILFACKDSDGHLWMPTLRVTSDGKTLRYESVPVVDAKDAVDTYNKNGGFATENGQNSGKNPDGTPKTSKTTQSCPADEKALKCSAQPCIDKAAENALADAQKVCDQTSTDASSPPKAGALTAETMKTKVNSQNAQCNSGPLPTLAPVTK